MSLASRRLAAQAWAAAWLAAIVVLAPSAAADPDIDTDSASTVVDELHRQGYTVKINGVPSGNTAMLTNCTVTALHWRGGDPPFPTGSTTTTVDVDVACPILRG